MTKPESEELLIKFYTSVKPWGFWKPIREKVKSLNPDFQENKNFGRDMVNIVIGTIWQISLMAAPLAFVFKYWHLLFITVFIIIVTSYLLKKNWYEKLEAF